MIKRTLTATIVLSLVFIAGCSEISELIEEPTYTSSAANPEITTKVERVSKWQMNQMKIDVGASDELPILLKLAEGDKADDYSHIAYHIGNTHLTSASVSPIDPGAAATKTFAWTAQPSSHAIKAIADSNEKIAESDEPNNVSTFAFLTPAPDLIIETITWSPESPSIGDTVTFTVTIKNQGGSRADYSRVAYYIDDTYLTSASVGPIDPGAAAIKTFTWKAEVGSHAIKAVADSNEEVAESDESNNVSTFTFSTLAPDLIIETITWSPESPSKDDTVTFSITIKNRGSSRAGSSRVYFYIDGSSRGYQNVLGIDTGAIVTKTFTWTARAGSYAIKAVADGVNHVTESDETNNEKMVTFSTLAPDLTIETITWSPGNASKSDNVTFTVTIKNQGSGRADYSRVAYYIDDTYLTSASVNPIDPGATDNKTFAWTAQAGSHAIKAVADSNEKVAESDEINNEKTITFSTLDPDLIIDTITWLPESPSIGGTVTFTATIKNQGSSRADYSRVAYYIDGSFRGSQDVPEIDAGATVTKTFTWKAEVGSYAIKAIADSTNHVTESDETNNEKTVTFSDISLSDLIVQEITWSPESPSIGDKVTFIVTIKNQGSGRADYSHVAYYIDDTYLTSASVNPIDAGATDNKTFTWKAEVGSHTIKAVADSNKRVTENDENNNVITITFSALVPDLTIETITGSPAEPSIGDTVTFTVTIKNRGSSRAGSSHVAYYIDGSFRGYQDVPEIDAGTTVTKTFAWTAQAGLHDIKIVADYNEEVDEGNENNNEKMVIFPIPDLTIETITWSPESPLIGNTVTFTATIKNQGTSRAGSSRIAYYIDDSSKDYHDIPEIDAGTTVKKTFTWTAQAGLHDIKIVADSNEKIAESDENNNEKTVTLTTLAPDLIIETITWSPADPSKSDNVTFTVTIKNQGSSRAGSSRIAYYIDGSSTGYQDVPEIDVGTTVTKTLIWTAQAGSHDTKIVADSNEEVDESDENNNEKTVTFSVFLPPATTPAPAPTPSIKPQEAPAGKPTPVPSPRKGTWSDLLLVFGIIVLVGMLIIALLRSRQRGH